MGLAEAQWYVLQTFSGYEDKVASSILTGIKNLGLEGFVFDVKVPREDVEEVRDGRKIKKVRKLFPGYVFVKIMLTDKVWQLLTGIRGCYGFAGDPYSPTPLTKKESEVFGVEKRSSVEVSYKLGDTVSIIDGALIGYSGTVVALDVPSNAVTVEVNIFGRQTPVSLGLEKVALI